jgi:2-methylisocitrate lyase-like PEP mutase family enzyme
MGFKLVIAPGSMVRVHAFVAQQFLQSLKANGTTALFREKMLDFKQINELLGLPDLMEEGALYDGRGGQEAAE